MKRCQTITSVSWFESQEEVSSVSFQIMSPVSLCEHRCELKQSTATVIGKANEELVALVAEHFKCRKAAVAIKAGASGRTKLIKVETQ